MTAASASAFDEIQTAHFGVFELFFVAAGSADDARRQRRSSNSVRIVDREVVPEQLTHAREYLPERAAFAVRCFIP